MRNGILLSTAVHFAILLSSIFGLPAMVEPRGLERAVAVELVVLEVPGPASQPGPPPAGNSGVEPEPDEQEAESQPEPASEPRVEEAAAEKAPVAEVVEPQHEPAPVPEPTVEAVVPSAEASLDEVPPSEPLSESPEPPVELPAEDAVAPPLPREEKSAAIATLLPPPDLEAKVEPEKQVELAPPPPVPPRRPKLPDFVAEAVGTPPAKFATPIRTKANLEPDTRDTLLLPERGAEGGIQTTALPDAGAPGPAVSPKTQGEGGGSVSAGNPATAADYAARLRAWLERHKRYPRRAKLRGQEGTVLLRFVLLRDGSVSDYDIAEGSGYLLLDEEVKELIRRAQPLPPIPGDLAENRMEFLVPFEFSLADAALR